MLTPTCVCGSMVAEAFTRLGLEMLRCECGIERQFVPMTLAQYAAWYTIRYHDGVYYHSYEQDLQVGNLRLNAYNLPSSTRLLDVGCGNNAFIHAARARGINAWGQDMASQADGPFTYACPLAECRFPTGHFDAITMHDVLEHVPDPRAFLQEVRRILKPEGQFLLDWPRFHAPDGAGDHHWKPVEHLWMLTDCQVKSLLGVEGFTVSDIAHPLASRSVFRATTPAVVASPKILVPAGIGDGYWVLAKLRGFIAREGLTLPEIWVHDAGPRRSEDFWRKVPFIRFGGYGTIPKGPWASRAYTRPEFVVQRDVPGYEYFLSLNGALEYGRTLDQAMDVPTEWYPQLFQAKEEDQYTAQFRQDYGNYVAVAFWDQGFYARWLREFSIKSIVQALRTITQSGKRVVIMGADWDKDGISAQIARADPRFVNLVGHTSYDALVGLIRGSAGVFGFPAGSTLLGAFLKRPTTLLWNRHFRPAFWWNVCPPKSPYYMPLPARSSPRSVALKFLQHMETLAA